MKKYTSGSFTTTKYAIYKEDTDTITSFPTEIIADGENASAVIYGNMQQSGTPTPENPIYPSECGELISSNYTIPIISGGVTTNINLSAAQTTRKINKLVFDGTETWYKTTGNKFNFQLLSSTPLIGIECVCSHYIGTTVTSFASLQDGQCTTSIVSSDIPRFAVSDDNYTEIATFKAYLAEQYTNGTPVTVWYVLIESTTGILNEPLRKIGEYADTVTSTIPTIAAADNINVTTTLKPSAVDLTYTGWHKYDDKKRSGGAWT